MNLTRNHNQDIAYWGSPSPDGFGGNTFADAVDIKGRWEDTQQKFISSTGEESISKAIVYVGQDIEIGGWLFLGLSSTLSSANQDEPELVSGAHEIRGFLKTPSLCGTEFERMVII